MPIEMPRHVAAAALPASPRGARAPLALAGSGAPEAADRAAAALSGLGAELGAAQARVRTREDAIERARAYGSFRESSAAELRRLQSEEDLSRSETVAQYRAFLDERAAETLAAHAGTQDSRDRLSLRLAEERTALIDLAASHAVAAQHALVAGAVERRTRELAALAGSDPASIGLFYAELDAEIDDYAPALKPEDEIAFRDAGRQQMALSAVSGLLDRGGWRDAQRLLAETPGLTEALSPEDRRGLDRRIAAFEQKELDAAAEGQRKIAELTAILGRPPTMAERVRLAGLEPPAGAETPADRIAGIEAALDRPLSPAEKAEILGIAGDTATPMTEAGKAVHDRELFVRQYGANSPQVQAFDDGMAAGEDPPDLSDVGGVRKEFTGLSKDFVQVRDAFGRIAEVSKDASAAGDLALIFNFMKMLDPGSTVREGEFATAQNSAGVPQRVINVYNRVMSGERLAAGQRGDFLGQSENLMRVMVRNQRALEDQFRGIATRSNLPPDDVVIDFVGEYREAAGAAGGPGDAAGAAPPGSRDNPIRLDLEGNVIGAVPAADGTGGAAAGGAGSRDNPHRPASIEDVQAIPAGDFYVDDAGNVNRKS